MANFDKLYLDTCEKILRKGVVAEGRNGITKRIPGAHWVFNLNPKYGGEFPILNCKKVGWKTATLEMMWIYLVQSIDVRWLQERNIHIWDKFETSEDGIYRNPDTGEEKFIGEEFAHTIGKSYAYIIKHGSEVADIDQVRVAINKIKNTPNDRRIIITMWQPPFFKDAVLPPCVYKVQYVVMDGKLYSFVEQRSCDTFLGVPFNITQYAMQHYMIAHTCGLEAGEMHYNMCDVHLYEEHWDTVEEMLKRRDEAIKMPAPTLWINPEIKDFFDFDTSKELKDIRLEGYENLGVLKGIVKA